MFKSSTEIFDFYQWSVEVHRKSFRRQLSIQVRPGRPIKVLASKLTNQKTILDFLIEKRPWLEKVHQKFEKLNLHQPPPDLHIGQKFPFLGKDLTFNPVITTGSKIFFSTTDHHLQIHIPLNEWSAVSKNQNYGAYKDLLIKYYYREAKKAITERIQHCLQITGAQPSMIKFRAQKSRWGSCSSRGVINLNLKMIVFKPELIDYVIIHEFCHLKHMNHSENFWKLVESYCPNYLELEKQMKLKQYQTHLFED